MIPTALCTTLNPIILFETADYHEMAVIFVAINVEFAVVPFVSRYIWPCERDALPIANPQLVQPIYALTEVMTDILMNDTSPFTVRQCTSSNRSLGYSLRLWTISSVSSSSVGLSICSALRLCNARATSVEDGRESGSKWNIVLR